MRSGREKISTLLGLFPKRQPVLPANYAAIYEQEYLLNRGRKTFITRFSGRLENWMHKQVANVRGRDVLEIGAGTLNHFRWEPSTSHYDVIEPFRVLYEGSAEKSKVDRFYSDISEVAMTYRYDKVLSIAVLEHLVDLPTVLARASQHLKANGVFQAAIPNEGGFLWWLSWRCTTGLAFGLRNRLDYAVIMRYEHVNSAAEIEGLIRCLFKEVTVKRFPLPFFHLSFYSYIEARKPNSETALHWLKLATARTH